MKPFSPLYLLVIILAFILPISFGCDDDDDDDDSTTVDDDDDVTDDDDDDVTDDDDDIIDDDDDTSADDDDDDTTVDDDDDDTSDDDDDDTSDDDDDDTVDDDDDDDTDDCGTLEDPDLAGTFGYTAFEYGHAGDPDARTTSVSQYFNFPDFYVWFDRGIRMNAVPLHGVGHIPNGAGPFPLVLIVHGNHDPAELSYPGYDYLTSHLASHGMIAISVEEDFLNGSVSGEMDARGIVMLRTLQLFREYNENPSHTLYGKIDMNEIGMVGHSRGGEGICAAWLFNTELHNPADPDHDFDFNIRSLFAIAPVDGQLFPFGFNEVILENVDYFIMHGSHDGDVSDFQGMQMFDRAFPEDQPGTGEKGALFVHGANHGQWNTVWAPGGDPWPVISPDVSLISAADQQQIGLNFITGFMRWTLQGRSCYRLMAAGETAFPSWPATVKANRIYQNEYRIFINHYEEDFNTSTTSWAGGTNTGTNLAAMNEGTLNPGETRICQNTWTSTQGTYRMDFPSVKSGTIDQMDMISFEAGQGWEASDVYNVHGQDQDFTVQLVVSGSPTNSVQVSSYRPLITPVTITSGSFSKNILDTVRIPLDDFSATSIDPAQVEAIIFKYDQKLSGLIGFDDIQFTRY